MARRKTSGKRKRARRSEAGGEGKKLREEGEQVMEAIKKAASKSYALGRKVKDGGMILVPGLNGGGGTGLDGDISFTVKGQAGVALTFLPGYQLQGEMEIEVEVQQYSDDTYLATKGVAFTETLCPEIHNLCLSPCSGILSFYNKVDLTFDSTYLDGLDTTSCGAANLLAKCASLEASFDPAEGEDGRACAPCFNRSAIDIRRGRGNLSGVWPADPLKDGGYRTYRAKIPKFPFRIMPPWTEARLPRDYPRVGIVPPDVDMRVLLRRETRIQDIMHFFPLRQSGKFGCSPASALTDTDTRSWRRYRSLSTDGGGETSKYKYYEVTKVTPKIRKLSLVVKKLLLDPKGFVCPPQTFSCYRTVTREMTHASSQVHLINWDLPQTPSTMFIMFLRETEVMGGGGASTKLEKILSTSSDLHYRPLNLTSLKLCDNTSPTADVLGESPKNAKIKKAYNIFCRPSLLWIYLCLFFFKWTTFT